MTARPLPSSAVLAMLRIAKLRATPQRVAILSVLQSAKYPLSVDELMRTARGTLDVATAYRVLHAFVSKGVARRIDLDVDRALYEITSSHHHHAMCTQCGSIRDLSVCLSPALIRKVRSLSGLSRIDKHTLEFFGLCKKCVSKKV